MRCLAFVVLLLPCIFADSGLFELQPQFRPPVQSSHPPGFYPFPPETKTCCGDAPWISSKLSKLNDNLFEIDQKNSIVFKRLSEIFDEVKAFESTQAEVDQYIIGTKIEIYQNGIKGVKGYQGVRGEHGDPGHPGSPGIVGPIGKTGERGVPGNQGRPGRKGAPGANGFKGPIGKVGPPGHLDENCLHEEEIHQSPNNDRKEHDDIPDGNDEEAEGSRFKRAAAKDKKEKKDKKDKKEKRDDSHEDKDRHGDWGWGKCAPPGERGPHGPQGAQGPTGAPGPHGHKGPKGYRGRAGHKGGRGADCCIGEKEHNEWAEPEW